MNVRQALVNRRTVHRFTTEPVPDQVVRRALHAATFAPNHKLTWPWRFVLVGPRTRAAIAEIAVHLKSAGRTLDQSTIERIRSKILDPGRLVVVLQQLAPDPHRQHEDYATCACAIQNLCLSVVADGFHTKWSTGQVTTHPKTYAQLGVDSTTQRVVGFVWIGGARAVPAASTRPAWAEVTRETP